MCLNLGTMSGGGTRVCKGKMGSAVVVDVDPKDVEEWQKQLDNVSHLTFAPLPMHLTLRYRK